MPRRSNCGSFWGRLAMFEKRPLSEVSVAIRDGTHGTHARASIGIPLLSAKNITKAGSVSWDGSDDCIAESEYRVIHSSFQLQTGDLLLTIVGTLGRRAIYRGERVTFQRSVAYIRPDPDKTTTKFLFHSLGHRAFTAQLKRRSNATAQAGLYLGELAQTTVPACSISEQEVIARILDTLDTQIEKTQALIAKLEQVKEGLLHDLLTRGVDENGELRPSPEEAPDLYKESELGLIPKGWVIATLDDMAENLDGRRVPLKKSERRSGVFPYYGASGIIDWIDGFIFDGEFVLLGEDGENVISRNLPLAFIARGRIWVNNHAHVYRPREDVDIHFLAELLESQDYSMLVNGSAQPKITQTSLRSLRFRKPALTEQRVIAARISSFERRKIAESTNVDNLRLLKAGLMDDLLTGRVRVTPLLEHEAAEAS